MDYWTPDRVLNALIEAYEVLNDMPDRGMQGVGSSWPSYLYEEKEIWEMRRQGTNTVGRMRARVQRRASEISAAERVLFGQDLKNGVRIKPWVPEFIPQKKKDILRCLFVYVFGTIKANRYDRDFNVADWCREKGMAESTFRSRRDRGVEMISSGLNKLKVPVW